MNRIFLDTNYLLDLTVQARPEHEVASMLFKSCAEQDIDMLMLSSSLKDVYYLLRRHYGTEATAREVISNLRKVLTPVALTLEIIDIALASDEPDYEDGLVRAAAEACAVDLIVSRDKTAFVTSPLKKVNARDLMEGPFFRS